MSDKVKVELNDDLSELLYLKYECDKKNFESFEDFINEINKYLELQMRKVIMKGKIKEIDEKLSELRI